MFHFSHRQSGPHSVMMSPRSIHNGVKKEEGVAEEKLGGGCARRTGGQSRPTQWPGLEAALHS